MSKRHDKSTPRLMPLYSWWKFWAPVVPPQKVTSKVLEPAVMFIGSIFLGWEYGLGYVLPHEVCDKGRRQYGFVTHLLLAQEDLQRLVTRIPYSIRTKRPAPEFCGSPLAPRFYLLCSEEMSPVILFIGNFFSLCLLRSLGISLPYLSTFMPMVYTGLVIAVALLLRSFFFRFYRHW